MARINQKIKTILKLRGKNKRGDRNLPSFSRVMRSDVWTFHSGSNACYFLWTEGVKTAGAHHWMLLHLWSTRHEPMKSG